MAQQHNPILQLALQQAMRDKPKRQQVKEATDLVYKRYAVLRQFKPLAIGVHEVLISELPQFDPVVVQRVIQRHCSTARYLKAMQREGFRYHLTGKRAAELTDLERDDAKRRLDAMSKDKPAAAENAPEAEADANVEVQAGERVQVIENVKAELGELIKMIDEDSSAKPA
ncbi:ProQ/FINO family protein [Laribacter hongkongensis]|uniref:ProQ/FINO family protein n=1 Tax=Laribacter hongkongensis TaxID=168471 RepID=UPI001EFDEC85|nr:ProQ/FINO family protein [Laribacter hongkongensis]MCG9055113.1 ProQ/FINO family protein [Laribacter hongkongensis]MCG9106165.1 ProQ/FINO family protein [Laribacter hongkongensis]MCG9114844.1 ProQ/FINO family protein [Laribacter hongkongensis]